MLLSVIIIIIIVAMYRSQSVCTLSIIIIKYQCPETTRKPCDRSHACICNSKPFVQSENLFSHISIDHVLLDFWCALNELKINLSENGFSSKSGIFFMYHRDGYVQKDIIVFRFRFFFGFDFFSDFHCSYPVLNIASFESRVLKFGCFRGYKG